MGSVVGRALSFCLLLSQSDQLPYFSMMYVSLVSPAKKVSPKFDTHVQGFADHHIRWKLLTGAHGSKGNGETKMGRRKFVIGFAFLLVLELVLKKIVLAIDSPAQSSSPQLS